jgi:hypothetical protein
MRTDVRLVDFPDIGDVRQGRRWNDRFRVHSGTCLSRDRQTTVMPALSALINKRT